MTQHHDHIIQKHRFELSLSNQTWAKEVNDRVREVFDASLNTALQEFFDRLPIHNKTVSLHKLELELGEIPVERLEYELVPKIIAALKAELSHLEEHPDLVEAHSEPLPDTLARNLEHYFTYGHLPWNTVDSVATLWKNLAQSSPDTLRQLLQDAACRTAARKRIAERMAGPLSVVTWKAWVPAKASLLRGYQQQLLTMYEKVLSTGTTQGQRERDICWVLITYLTVEAGRPIEPKQLISSTLRQLAELHTVPYARLVQALEYTLWMAQLPQAAELIQATQSLRVATGVETPTAWKLDPLQASTSLAHTVEEKVPLRKQDKTEAFAADPSPEGKPATDASANPSLALGKALRRMVEWLTGKTQPHTAGQAQTSTHSPVGQNPQAKQDASIPPSGSAQQVQARSSDSKRSVEPSSTSQSIPQLLERTLLALDQQATKHEELSTPTKESTLEKSTTVGATGNKETQKSIDNSDQPTSRSLKGLMQRALESLRGKDTGQSEQENSQKISETEATKLGQTALRTPDISPKPRSKRSLPVLFAKALATLLGKPIPTQNEAGTAKETAKPNQENDLEKRNTDNSGVFSTSPEQKEEPSLTPESNSSDPIAPSDEESTENDAPTRVPKVSADSEEAEPSLAVSPEGTLIETTPSPVPTQAQSSEADAPPRTILGRLGHWMARSWKRLFFKKKQSNEGQLIPQGDESIAKNPAKAQAMMPGRENTVLNEALQAGLTTANLPELQAAGFASLAELTAYMLDYQPRELWKTLRKIGAQAQAHWLETATQGQRHELLSRQPGLPQRVGRMLQLFQRKLAQADFGGAPQLIQTLSDTALAYLLARPTANVESTLLHLAKTLAGTSVPDNLWARLTGAESVEQEPKALHQQVLKPLWEATPGSENRTSIPYFTEEAEESSYYVANAGLILLHAYLPHLFGQLGYLSPTQKFKTEELAAQGAMLLQYIYNLQTEQDEETMALNRALTCLPQDFLLPAKYEPTSAEKALADQMLTAMIEHWAIISAHDLAGFRDTWLWRSGRLTEQEQKYELVVDTRAYDILLDKLPYTLSPAMLPWSDKPIYVQWR